MNEKILEALQTLAAKLGVTAEHLWGVLLKQAPIDGTVDFVMCAALVWLNLKLVRLVIKKTSGKDPEWEDESLVGAAWVCLAFLVLFSTLAVWFNIAMIIAAFFNPEYWALKQLL